MVRVERRRERRERLGVLNTIRMDVLRWMEACRTMADDLNARSQPGRGVQWANVAALAAIHLPNGLTSILFRLYMEREQTEAAYSEMLAGISEPARAYAARFSLRRWTFMAHAVLEEWDRYYQRNRRQRLWARLSADRLDRGGITAEIAAHERVLERATELLEDAHGYQIEPDGGLAPENHTQAAYEAMWEEFKAVQASENPLADAARQPRGNAS